MTSLRNLSKDKTIYIAKFDKGNGVCITDKSHYENFMLSLLSDSSKFSKYQPNARSSKNPFILAEDKFNRQLRLLRSDGSISERQFELIRSRGSQPARLYGLPKVHKSRTDPPYRPILSMPNSYCTNLSKYLDSILKPYVPTDLQLKDSFEFVDSLKSLDCPNRAFMVSFDVSNLFSNVPLDDTIDHLCTLIDFKEFPVNKNTLRALLNLACKNVLFQFQNSLYVQIDGVAMGSSLGPTLASFAMHLVESQIRSMPLYYRRYVDDVFAVFQNKKVAVDFLSTLNSIHPNIQFTLETEHDSKLKFLDVIVIKKDNKFETAWSLKDTNTGVYINRCAIAPLKYKRAAIRSLIFRAKHLSSTISHYEKAYVLIRQIFIRNGYHVQFIEKIKDEIDSKPKIQARQDTKTIYWRLPYVAEKDQETKKALHSINRVLPAGVRLAIAYRTYKTSNLFPNKDPVPQCLSSNVVYKFHCRQCNSCYIGETRRHLATRITEHVHGRPQDSEITKHSHKAGPDDFTIIHRTKFTKIAESLVIKSIPKCYLLNEHDSSMPLSLF